MPGKKKISEATWLFIVCSALYCLFTVVFIFFDGRFENRGLPLIYPVELLPFSSLVLVMIFVLYRD
jgi:hypothetical protein